jgi:hypothetical protein
LKLLPVFQLVEEGLSFAVHPSGKNLASNEIDKQHGVLIVHAADDGFGSNCYLRFDATSRTTVDFVLRI